MSKAKGGKRKKMTKALRRKIGDGVRLAKERRTKERWERFLRELRVALP